jgi:nucleoside-diphosphate-sugar epimerase
MKISIVGLGWFGLALGQELKTHHQILGTTRTEERAKLLTELGFETYILNPQQMINSALLESEVIILNIPPFKGQLDWFKSWNISPNTHLVFISSTSVYGKLQTDVCEETAPLPDTDNGFILLEEEKLVRGFKNHTIIRFGGLIGQNRHPGKFLSGRENLEGGNHPVNLIHQLDAVHFVKYVIEKKLYQETFNLVHPHHPTRIDYYGGYCAENNLPLPHFLHSNDPGKRVASDKVEKIYQFRQKI